MLPEDLMDYEVEAIRKGFKHFDREGSGNIKAEILGNCLRWLKLVPTEAEIASFKQLQDDNGYLRWNTFLFIVSQLWISDAQKREGAAWAAFLVFDKEDKGKLPVETMKRILVEYGEEPIPEKEVNKILKPFTDKKENTVEYGYIIRAWAV